MDSGHYVRVCVLSPPEFDVTTAALYVAWIAGKPPEALQALARELYERDSSPSQLSAELAGLEEEDEVVDEQYMSRLDVENVRGLDLLEASADSASAEELSDNGWDDGGGGGTSTFSSTSNMNNNSSATAAASTFSSLGANVSDNATAKATQVETSSKQQLHFSRKKNHYANEITELIRGAVCDDICTFEALEHYLQTPTLLRSQTMIQLRSVKMQSFVVEKYWSLDDVVAREVVVGSKRLTRSRKDLDDVSETTGVSLRSVTRQFDNIKRLYTHIEDLEDCNLYEYMRTNILLSPELSRKYACILFLLYSKFTLTSKKRIQRIKFKGLDRCAALTLACLISDVGTFFRVSRQCLMTTESGGWAFRSRSVSAAAVATTLQLHNSSVGVSNSDNVSSPSSSTVLLQPPVSTNSAIVLDTVTTASNNNNINNNNNMAASVRANVETNNTTTSTAPLQLQHSNSGSGSSPERPHSSSTASALIDSSTSPPPPQSPPLAASLVGLPEVTDDMVCEALFTGDMVDCWSLVWSVLSYVGAMDADKLLMTNLRDIKAVVTGEVLNNGCQLVISSLQERQGGASIVRKLDNSGRLRSVLKSLMQIGANLSQSKEYRDFFEDLLTKVAEPLEEAGLTLNDMKSFLTSCSVLARAIPDTHRISALTQPSTMASQGSTRKDTMDRRKDWARFVFCVKLVLFELVEGCA